MSANPDVEPLLRAWWGIPSKAFEGWQSSVREGLSPPWNGAYGRGIDAMETLTHTGLRMQTDWLRMTLDGVRSGSGESPMLGQWSTQAQSMVDAWSDASQQLTHIWFQMIKDLGPFFWTGLTAASLPAMVKNPPGQQWMQQMVRNGLKLQAAWASLLMPQMLVEEASLTSQEAGREKPERKATRSPVLETEQAA